MIKKVVIPRYVFDGRYFPGFYFVKWLNCNNINGTIFSAPDAHFDNTCLFSDARGQNM